VAEEEASEDDDMAISRKTRSNQGIISSDASFSTFEFSMLFLATMLSPARVCSSAPPHFASEPNQRCNSQRRERSNAIEGDEYGKIILPHLGPFAELGLRDYKGKELDAWNIKQDHI
jgi:hypothetical protein